MRKVRRRGRRGLLGLALGALAALPATAVAGDGMQLEFDNQTDAPMTIRTTASDCWSQSPDGLVVAPRSSSTQYLENATTFPSCSFFAPQSVTLGAAAGGKTAEGLAYTLTGNAAGNDMESTWLPVFPEAGVYWFPGARVAPDWIYPIPVANGGGFFCSALFPTDSQVHWKDVLPWSISFEANRQDCGGYGPDTKGPEDPVSPSAPTIASLQSGSGAIVDLMATLDQACRSIGQDPDRCDDAGTQAKSDFSLLETDVAENRFTNQPTLILNPSLAGQTKVDNTQGQSPITNVLSYTQTNSQQTTTTTTSGWQVGGQLTATYQFGVKDVWSATGQLQLSASHNWSSQAAVQTGQTTQTGETTTVTTPPGTSYLYQVIQQIGGFNPDITASLRFGTDGASDQPVTSGYFPVNGIGPASQTCVGYLVGDENVEQSILDIAQQVQQSGAPPVPGLTYPLQQAAASMSSSPTPCAGFPKGFGSAAEFQGTAQGSSQVAFQVEVCAYELSGGPAPDPSTVPAAAGALPAVPASDSLCPDPSSTSERRRRSTTGQRADSLAGGATRPVGNWIDHARRPAGHREAGTAGNDAITADSSPDRDTFLGRGGRDLLVGGRYRERLVGGAGRDLLQGGGGADRLEGGPGNDALDGGEGADVLVDVAGRNHLDGGPGADRIVVAGTAHAIGGDGRDSISYRGGNVQMIGGAGDDTYTVTRRGAWSVREAADEGYDTVRSAVSLAAPFGVEHVVLTGSRDADILGNGTSLLMEGNAGDNVIRSRSGWNRVKAGAGDDTVVLSRFGYDRATGGPGADRFVVDARPATRPRSGALARPSRRTAHVVTDFSKEDRIVLSERAFGPGIRAGLEIVHGTDPAPRSSAATVLVDDRTGLVSIDPDGTGRLDDVVLVMVPRPAAIERSSFEIAP